MCLTVALILPHPFASAPTESSAHAGAYDHLPVGRVIKILSRGIRALFSSSVSFTREVSEPDGGLAEYFSSRSAFNNGLLRRHGTDVNAVGVSGAFDVGGRTGRWE